MNAYKSSFYMEPARIVVILKLGMPPPGIRLSNSYILNFRLFLVTRRADADAGQDVQGIYGRNISIDFLNDQGDLGTAGDDCCRPFFF
jgi:hypothetical protein